MTYTDSPEHRAAVYALSVAPEMREWARADFLVWLNRVQEEAWDAGWERFSRAWVNHQVYNDPWPTPTPNPYRNKEGE